MIYRYLDTLQRSEEEYAALKDNIKAAKDAKKKVKPRQTLLANVQYHILGLEVKYTSYKIKNLLPYASMASSLSCLFPGRAVNMIL